jgi:hypothetical protein
MNLFSVVFLALLHIFSGLALIARTFLYLMTGAPFGLAGVPAIARKFYSSAFNVSTQTTNYRIGNDIIGTVYKAIDKFSILDLHQLGLFSLLLDGKIEWSNGRLVPALSKDLPHEGNLVTLKQMTVENNKVIVIDMTTGAASA